MTFKPLVQAQLILASSLGESEKVYQQGADGPGFHVGAMPGFLISKEVYHLL